MKQVVRIIGGQYRGKKLHFPDLAGLRPTPNRVKETLFNWLMHDLRGARCLDAFAGSGSLGFEALSRGAERVVFIEASLEGYNNLKQIALSFNSPKLSVVHGKAEDYFCKATETFDLVFLDPPFSENYLPDCLERLARSNLLISGGLVYLETANKLELDPSIWLELKSKQAGQVSYSLYRKLPIRLS